MTTTPPDLVEPTSPPPRGDDRRRRRRRTVRLVVLGAVVLMLLAVGWFVLQAYPIGGSGPAQVFEVTDGESIQSVASSMAAKGIIGSTLAFRLDLMVAGTPNVEPGWYSIPSSSSFSTVRGVLSNGPNATALSVVTSESALEIAQGLASVESGSFGTTFLSLVRNGAVASTFQPTPHTSLEGLLAPGTYVLVPHETPATLLQQMVSKFEARAASVGLTPTTTIHGLSAYDVLTVASIVEKEGYLARNMPKTATVVYNRLARGTPLQMDATVEYAIGQDGGPVTHATEAIQSPYNSTSTPGSPRRRSAFRRPRRSTQHCTRRAGRGSTSRSSTRPARSRSRRRSPSSSPTSSWPQRAGL